MTKTVKSKEKVEKVKAENVSKLDDEPSWYHYLIVLAIMALIFGIFWGGYQFFVGNDNSTNQSGITMYKYVYKVGNVTYNLYFESQIAELDAMPYPIEPNKYDVLNTLNYRLAFAEYNGSDNGQVAKASTKLTSFLKLVEHFQFTNESFVKIDVINCSNSTIRNKVITFNPYSEETGVFYDRETGCIEFKSDDATKMIDLADKFIYKTVGKENVK